MLPKFPSLRLSKTLNLPLQNSIIMSYIVGTDYGIFRRFHKNFNARTDLAKFLNQIKEAEKYFKHLFVIIQEDLRKAQWGSPKNLKQVLRKLSMVPFHQNEKISNK